MYTFSATFAIIRGFEGGVGPIVGYIYLEIPIICGNFVT